MKTFGALTLSILLGGINGLVIREDGINYTIEGLELLNTTSSVDKRANYEFKDYPKHETWCPWGNGKTREVIFSSNAVLDALEAGGKLQRTGKQIGSGAYPHTYYNKEGDITNINGNCNTDRVSKNVEEFPILTSGLVYTGAGDANRPGNERVLFQLRPIPGSNGNDFVLRFCGVMTHRQAPSAGRFSMCTWS